ncbi:hypothetical protein FLONG3_42 [Fusarium longipes]|uniref:Cas1p 10 TM acyl transferase domain-containing protein n=1 Tax=Fusarium longipes TaxID=694270 RepID=A0A395TC41_9HYPO|nr:hypothetical protein FLONG3_42 [Fusarium longipes]
MDLPLSRILSTILATLFLTAVAFKTFTPNDDPYRCRALQNTGRWIDPPDEDGHRFPFHQWQPDGCILNEYDSSQIRQCTEGRRIVIAGDSTSRRVAYAFGRLIDREKWQYDSEQKSFAGLRDNVNLTYDGQMIQRISNVFIGAHGEPIQERSGFVYSLDAYAAEKRNPRPIQDQESPAIIYMAAGLWFTNNKNNNSGHVHWKPRFTAFKHRFDNLSKYIDANTPHDDPFSSPMDPYDGIGNQIFFAPPAGPVYQGNESKLAKVSARRAKEVVDIQNWLYTYENKSSIPILWSIPGLTTNQNKTWIDPLRKAAHVIDQVAEVRANILLNLRCNAKLDREKRYPYTRTCCTDYGGNQYSIPIIISIVYLTACILCELLDLLIRRETQWRLFNMQLGSFVLVLLTCYFADRTQMMAKGSRLFEVNGIAVLFLSCLVVYLVTIRRSGSKSLPYRSLSTEETSESLLPETNVLPEEKDDQDQYFLSRNLTEEWKGGMQYFVLIYQWSAAEQGSMWMYILLRLCVAAYLFQTGYGHATYFINTSDFSFNRVVATLLRLNILSWALAYFMNTDYMFYQAASLASFWFLVVYVTLAYGRQKNNDPQVILAKACISCIVVSVLSMDPLPRWFFSLLEIIFNIHWNADEWMHCVTLDIYIVYVGIITAAVSHRMQNTSANVGLRLTLGLASPFVVLYYLWKASSLTTDSYDILHTYASWIPIMAFIALRNVSTYTRNYHSRAMVWLGRHSLEISVLQSHVLLAADKQGVLVINGLFGDGSVLGDRWRTLLILVPIFLWLCYAAKSATTNIIDLVLHESPDSDDLDGPTFAWLKVMGISHIPYAKIRLACILLLLWSVNLLSARTYITPPPPGGHELTVEPMSTNAINYPY